MADLIVTQDAGVIAYGLLDELLTLLISKDVISNGDRAAMLASLHKRLEKDTRSGGKSAALTLGQRINK